MNRPKPPPVNLDKYCEGRSRNKRIGTHAMLVFLALNGIELQYTQKDLYEIILDIAASKKGYEDLLQWVIDHKI